MPIFTPYEACTWKDIIGEEKASKLAVFEDSGPKCETFAEFRERAYAGFTPAKLEPQKKPGSIPELFLDFLDKQGCGGQWARNFNPVNSSPKVISEFLAVVPPYQYIDWAFNWSNTPEGGDFWFNIFNFWNLFLNITGGRIE